MGEGDQGDLVKVEQSGGELVPLSGEDEIARLRAEIDSHRDRIRLSIDGLQDEIDEKIDWIEEKVDWKGWVKENPYKTVGFAFAVGFLLGSS